MSSYNKNLVFTAACIGMSFFGVSMITMGAVLPSLTGKLMLNDLQAGALVTFLPVGLLVGSLLFGPIVDRFGHKVLMLFSCIVVLLGLEGIALFSDIPLLQLSILCIGLGGGILNGETNALVADISSDEEKGARLSLLGAFYGIGALGIPVLMGFLSKHYSFETILQGTGVLMLICIIFCMFIRFPAPKQPQGFPIREGIKLLKEKSLLLFSLILFFQSGIEGVTNNWTTSYLGRTTEIPADKALLVLTCMVAGLTAARLLLVVIFKKVKESTVLICSLVMAGVGFLLLMASPEFWRAALGMVLIGAGVASTFPVILSILGQRYAALSGTAFSIAMVIALTGNTLLNNLTGILSQKFGITVFPYMMITAIVIMIVLFRWAFRSKTPPRI
ncbi:sugar MFS transporter [Bacteroides sp. 51]|uniref:MFS transporter n=1 Tax=Bacteroides sp. 51 TaxID=2302938 RepID=UPI0013D12037|nr:MFS transporter [Bacteroides sp. 51]NDV81226.1 MFS transporter [Bacteroides sp. 51]